MLAGTSSNVLIQKLIAQGRLEELKSFYKSSPEAFRLQLEELKHQGESYLYLAAKHIDVFIWLIARGVEKVESTNNSDKESVTIFTNDGLKEDFAILKEQFSGSELKDLLDRKNTISDTALHTALYYADWSFAEILLECGANPWTGNQYKHNAYFIAVQNGAKDEEFLNKLYYLDIPKMLDSEGKNIFHIAAYANNFFVFEALLKKQVAEAYLSHYINDQDNYFNTPFHIVLYKKQWQLAVRLLENGANETLLDSYKRNAFFIAVRKGASDISLLNKLITPNIATLKDVEGRNIFHMAVLGSNTVALEILLKELDRDTINDLLATKDHYGMTPIDLVACIANDACVELLQPYIAEDIKASQEYGKKLSKINQNHILTKCRHYLKLLERREHFLEDSGYCRGLEYLAGFYAMRGKLDHYFDILSVISRWDGTKEALDGPVFFAEGDYKNLSAVFEQFIQDIILAQNSKKTGELITIDDSFIAIHDFMQGKNVTLPKFPYCIAKNLFFFPSIAIPINGGLSLTGVLRHIYTFFVNYQKEIFKLSSQVLNMLQDCL